MNPIPPLPLRLRREISGVILLYLIWSCAYVWVLNFTTSDDFEYFGAGFLDYFLKGLWTLPVWLIIFKALKNRPRWIRYAAHLVLLPLWIFLWIQSYYWACELIDYYHLMGRAIGWDIYIPALFYVLQFGVFHLYDESRRLIGQQKRANDLREMALKSELAALKAQLNPHFLYNVFNTINASLSPQEEYTRELIAKLSDLFRYQLKASKLEFVPLSDELAFIRTYLELEKARYRERLEIKWTVDPALQTVLIPPMLIQPIVENAIRHGISPRIEGGKVEINIQQIGKQIRIAIIDDGIGFQQAFAQTGNGVGLQNTRKMLQSLYGKPVEIQENKPAGTRVQFNIPLTTADNTVLL